jgi:integrase
MSNLKIKRVRIKNGSYHIDLGRDENGKRRSKKLSRIGDGESALYKALADFTKLKTTTIKDLLIVFLSRGIQRLSPRTQADYCYYARTKLCGAFGDMAPEDLEPTHVAQYLEKRSKMANAGANKEIACLSSAFEFGQRLGLCNGNPCRQVRRNRVRPKRRYVRDDEFRAVFNAAPEALQDLIAGIYLMGLRPGEARSMLRSSLTPNGIRFEESKTGKVKEIAWSPALQFFITRATSRFPESRYVFANSKGERWTNWAMHSAMARLREEVGGESFTFHDLRAKAESDHKEGMGLLPLYKRAHRVTPVR